MAEVKTVIGAGGRIVIPAGYRKALGVRPGDEVLLLLEEDEIRIVNHLRSVEVETRPSTLRQSSGQAGSGRTV